MRFVLPGPQSDVLTRGGEGLVDAVLCPDRNTTGWTRRRAAEMHSRCAAVRVNAAEQDTLSTAKTQTHSPVPGADIFVRPVTITNLLR